MVQLDNVTPGTHGSDAHALLKGIPLKLVKWAVLDAKLTSAAAF